MDSAQFRRLLGRFATGVTVITTGSVEQPHGMTANAFASLSLEPPLVLVCIDHRRQSHRRIQEQGWFGVSVLAESQRWVADLFAARVPEEAVDSRDLFEAGALGLPLIGRCLAQLECRLTAVYPGGDHSIFVGEVVHGRLGPSSRPLIFFGGSYRELDPG